MKDCGVPVLLSRVYGLRACEIVEKKRLTTANPAEHTIEINGKGGRTRLIHIRAEDYPPVVEYYHSRRKNDTITYGTLYNRLQPYKILEPGHVRFTVTHRGRKERYSSLPPNAPIEAHLATSLELGHSMLTGWKSYNTRKIAEHRKELLKSLPLY